MSISPNMNLIIPPVSTTDGPEWAESLNADLGLIDSHDHSSGFGVPISPSGLDINTNLSFASNAATNLGSARFTSQSSPLSSSILDAVYVSGVDLYYNDGNGNQVRITQSGGVAGSPGSISNLTAPASAAYVSGSTKFVWESDSNVAANMDCGSIILRNLTASSFGITLQPPTLASNYSITLPAVPASQKFMTMNSSGVMAAPWAVDNSTLEIASSTTLQVKDGGITNPKLAALNYLLTDTCSNYTRTSNTFATVTNLTGSYTTTGRAVRLQLISDGSANASLLGTTSAILLWKLRRDGTDIAVGSIGGTNVNIPVSSISYVDFDVIGAATSYTYDFQIRSATNTIAVQVFYAKLLAVEI